MKSLVAVVLFAAVLLLAVACGSDGVPSVRITLEGDFTRLPPDTDLDEVWDGVKDVLERRLDAFGASGEFTREGPNRLNVELRRIDPDEARDLLGDTGHLEFREPVRDEQDQVVCEATEGGQFSVLPQQVTAADSDDRRIAQCVGGGGQTGEVVWELAACQGDECGDSEGVGLTGKLVRPNAQLIADSVLCGNIPPCVGIEFTGEGGLIFENITTRLVGLPLGIFLDDELVTVPTVQQPITVGAAIITGLEGLDEARTLAIQLNAGALPVPVRVVSIDEIP